jgi:hypothetical protein
LGNAFKGSKTVKTLIRLLVNFDAPQKLLEDFDKKWQEKDTCRAAVLRSFMRAVVEGRFDIEVQGGRVIVTKVTVPLSVSV